MIVDPDIGCSISQLCPCDGPRGTNNPWKNHGKYVSCVAHASGSFLEKGLISEEEKSQQALDRYGRRTLRARIHSPRGLDNLHRRARELGADLRMDSAPGTGTAVHFSVLLSRRGAT